MRIEAYGAIAVASVDVSDIRGMEAALNKALSLAKSGPAHDGTSDFTGQMTVLKVTAPLITGKQFDTASRWLDFVEHQKEGSSRTIIEPEIDQQRVVLLAKKGQFDEARTRVAKMRPDASTEDIRGSAVRALSFLQTKKQGIIENQKWIESLPSDTDRSYALLGAVEALMGKTEVQLSYGGLQIQ